MELIQWDSIYDVYKLSLVELIYNIVRFSSLISWKIQFVTEELSCGNVSRTIFTIHVVLNNFIQRQNLIRYLGKSDLR